MSKPAILVIDDDPVVSQAIARDLRVRYGSEYQVVRAGSGAEGLTVLSKFALRDRRVALIATDQRMPSMTGIQFLEQARQHTSDAKLVLVTAYADTEVAIKAINDIGLDYYLQKPWDPPDERLYPAVDELLYDWRQAHPDETPELRVIGDRWSERAYEIKTFLARNHVPYSWLDVERDSKGRRLQHLAGAGENDLPLVLVPDGEALKAPSISDLADSLGLRTRADQPLYDLCIIGGGPAGLAAAVYAASEGLQAVVVERDAPGGQAGQSASIENYLGFPKGLSGSDLTYRAVAQAKRLGAEIVLARQAVGFEVRGPVRAVSFDDGSEIESRALIIASGVSYRLLAAEGLDRFTGRGVYYGATASEARLCAGDDVYMIGAANSAGQAALNFAGFARRVVLVVRAEALESSMSHYLVERIGRTPNIEVRLQTEVVAARGNGHLEAITLFDRATHATEDVKTSWLFVFIGAAPRTEWLGPEIARDDKGFIVTGNDLLAGTRRPQWALARPPLPLETSVPGVFAAGDVRLESMKRVASAVGEGAMSVYLVHRYLATV